MQGAKVHTIVLFGELQMKIISLMEFQMFNPIGQVAQTQYYAKILREHPKLYISSILNTDYLMWQIMG